MLQTMRIDNKKNRIRTQIIYVENLNEKNYRLRRRRFIISKIGMFRIVIVKI